jgi:hypothetical protein
MKRSAFKVLIMAFVCTGLLHAQEGRQTYNFNHGWKVYAGPAQGAENPGYDDSSWKQVSLPYAWNGDEAFEKDIRELSTGIAWYRKQFRLPGSGKKVFIEFEGVRQAAEVYVNGVYAGLHENGITAFGFDITEFVYFGDRVNVIAVRTDNDWDYTEKSTGTKFQWSDRNFNANYGGIPKNVILHVTGTVYQTLPLYSNLGTTGPYIYARDIDVRGRSALITAETQVANDSRGAVELDYRVEIDDAEGNTVCTMDGGSFTLERGESKTISAEERVGGLNFWSWGYGYLYTVHTILEQDGRVIDRVSCRTGFRKTEFSGGLFRLNDRVIMVKGYAQRTSNEWPATGVSVPPWMSDYSNKLMLESNANLVRWMHTAPWKQDVESCDRVGLMQAMPAGDSEKDREGRQWEQRVEAMRDAIIYYRNNPSIIFYEAGNKGISEAHMQEMKDLRDKYDPYGGRAAGCREMLDSRVAEYGGEMLYVNKSDGKPVWAMEYMRDEGLRKYWDEHTPPYHRDGDGPLYKGQDASAYNRNQDSYAREAVRRWWDYYRERPGSGKRVSSGGVNIIFSETNTHHRGEENYRRSGEVDAMRIPKDAFFAHQTMWNGWVDIEEHGTYIIGHWNYTPGVVKDVMVVSTGERVELLVNGLSYGCGKREYGFLFTFDDIAWEPGKIEALSYAADGSVLASDSRKTAGPPQSIRLRLMTSVHGVRADGSDMAMVEVEVVDSGGQRCPTAMNTIDFRLEGAGSWRGGMAQGPGNFILSPSLPVECGVNRVLIRSITNPGEVRLEAESEGLEGASLSFTTKEVEVINGLSLQMPSDGLPLHLDRGPTPVGVSFSEFRRSVGIIGAEAGANQENAALSYDGSQDTRWVNDGKIESGWIEYTLEREVPVSEIALKLSGWRTRSYPLVVSANDSVLYMGVSSPNLGYYYITPAKPVLTDNIKVRLFGQTEFNDVYKLVEITGKLDKETADDLAVKNAGNLNIAEIEVFEEL